VSQAGVKPYITVLVLAAASGCSSASAPEPAAQVFPASDVAVALGDTITLAQTGLRIGFREVASDSRCPVDAVCIWSGNAEIVLDLLAPPLPVRTGRLNTDSGNKELVFTGYLVQLTGLDPAPYSNDSTRAYIAHLRWRYLPD